MQSPTLTHAKALFDPAEGVSTLVDQRRWGWPLMLLVVAVSLSGAAVAVRWDATSKVTAELEAKGELARSSEREVLEQVQTSERIALVGGVAKGLFVMPLLVLALGVVLKLSSWLLGASASFARCFTAAAVGTLPIALYHLLLALVAIRQLGVTQGQLATLLPSSLLALSPQAGPKLARLLSAVDFFNLWSAAMVGVGFAAASGLRKSRGLGFGLALYAMYVGVFMLGVPGLGAGQ